MRGSYSLLESRLDTLVGISEYQTRPNTCVIVCLLTQYRSTSQIYFFQFYFHQLYLIFQFYLYYLTFKKINLSTNSYTPYCSYLIATPLLLFVNLFKIVTLRKCIFAYNLSFILRFNPSINSFFFFHTLFFSINLIYYVPKEKNKI
jgi:hypothetical protein